ncbi:MAG: polysaccharide deacetylase family protein [Oscillospiraceae bacterium]
MYLGSVKFYKHIIYLSILLISVAVIFGAFSGIKAIAGLFSEDENTSVLSCLIDARTGENTINHYPDGIEYPYQKKYPQLYAEKQQVDSVKPNVCYLTFDDGPSKLTTEVLDILDKNNIKATFFVVINSNTNYDLIKDAINRGHSIGIHSHTHNYRKIYADVDSFINDMDTANNLLIENTGYKASVIRFPGGSINSYNSGYYSELVSEIVRRNYHYFDWNVSTQDASNNITKNQIINNVEKGLDIYGKDDSRIIVLAHDSQGRYATVDSLQEIIDKIAEKGYTFETLDNSVPIMSFGYNENN